jgi:hypothetical protein
MQNRLVLTGDALTLSPGDSGAAVSDLQTYLGRFGWLRVPDQERVVAAHDELPEAQFGSFDEATEAALADFQRFYRLSVTGRPDAETLALMQRPRCGVPDKPPVVADGTAPTFATLPNKWTNSRAVYNLSAGTADLSTADVNAALAWAYRTWCLVAQLVVRAGSSSPDIDVRFASGDHGDGAANAFDGVGTVLAHAFGPPPSGGSSLWGDLHFDDAEAWTRNLPPTGTDLDTVALHEGGHTLGLDHSADNTAVMFAFYAAGRRTLTPDDISGIRSVYGTRARNTWTNLDTSVEGEGSFLGKAYFFRGDQYLRYDYGDDLPDPGYPKSIGVEWHGLPGAFTGNLDATVNGQNGFAGKLYFFKGDQYVRYDWASDKTDPGYPKSIAGNWPGLPDTFTSRIDAAVTGKGRFSGKAYFFKGDQYVRYDWANDKTDPGYPKSIAGNWPGLPPGFTSNLQAAVNGQKAFDGKLYFFAGANYTRYDWTTDRNDPGYPLPIAYFWL